MDGVPARDGERRLTCGKCGLELVLIKSQFSYLGHSFHADIPRCPGCGQAFISEELAKGRISEVETLLEDK
jgi:ribosomal protein S27AE